MLTIIIKKKKFPLAISGILKSNPKYDDTFFNIEDIVGESLIFSHEIELMNNLGCIHIVVYR